MHSKIRFRYSPLFIQKIPLYARLFPVSLAIAAEVSVVDYWVEK